ncbi:MAG: exonuclease SbcCD subunit D [Candidatus Nanohaloarchaea archaeon]
MKVSIISDTHFGYKWGEERGEDAFRNAEEAFERSLDADLIILPGDIFDRKIPKQEVLDRAADVLSVAMEGERTVEADKNLGMHGDGIPVVTIHGTHERRPSSYTNPIELMSNMGHLYHLHNEKVEFEKDGEKVAVHGMSGVPEEYAKDVMRNFSPEPVDGAFNILVLHQSIEGFVYTPEEEDYLALEDIPEGFDLVVDGHIHWYNIERFEDGDERPLVLPGSTVTTQMRKVEAEKDKGFLRLDTEKEELEFVSLEEPREVHYIELEVSGEPWSEIKEKAREELQEIVETGEKPLVNLKITGETSGRVNPRELKQLFRDSMFLNINSSLSSDSTPSGTDIGDVDAVEEGKDILEEKIDAELEFDRDQFFELLEEGDVEEAMEVLDEVDIDDREG